MRAITAGDRMNHARPGTHDAWAGGTVVGYDGSPEGDSLVRWAAAEAERSGLRLTVLYAADVFGGRRGQVVGPATATDLSTVGQRMAQRGAAVAREARPDVVVRGLGRSGGTAGELVAASENAGFVVVGRSTSDLDRTANGVSFAVAMHARCPVVVVPDDWTAHPGPDLPVLVGVDGSVSANAALVVAAAMARGWGAPLHVVAAWQHREDVPWQLAFGRDETRAPSARSVRDRAERDLEDALALARGQLGPDRVTGGVVQSTAADALMGEDAAMVVVGNRGLGGFPGLVLGSVGHGVLARSAAPVTVVRHGSL